MMFILKPAHLTWQIPCFSGCPVISNPLICCIFQKRNSFSIKKCKVLLDTDLIMFNISPYRDKGIKIC